MGAPAMSLVKMYCTNFSASAPLTSTSPMWLTSNTPQTLRTALCSSTMSVYWMGISKPPKGTILAPNAMCLS